MALPVNGSTRLIPAYYSFYRPRKDERLSWPSWLTYSGWLTHISGHPSAAGRAQDRESSPARDRRSTTVPRRGIGNRNPPSSLHAKNKLDLCLRFDTILDCDRQTDRQTSEYRAVVSEHGRRHLRSSSYRTLAVLRTRTTLGDRSFAVAGPRVWNSLPATI